MGKTLIFSVLIFLAATAQSILCSQDPIALSPKHYKVLINNPSVRVFEFRDQPGDRISQHRHPDYIAYTFGPFKRKFYLADGSAREIEGKGNDVIWSNSIVHSDENTGTTETRALALELKETSRTGKPALVLTDPVKVEPEHYTVLFENDRVRLLQFKDKPGDKIAMHGHPDYVAYTMKALKRRLIAPDGSYRDVQAEAGTAVWSEAVTHAEVNIGDTETHLLLFEVK